MPASRGIRCLRAIPSSSANPNVVFNGVSNPAANVRTEFFSAGLRNPFRFSIDTDHRRDLGLGDVGQVHA
jgi:hypothetical protein